jgi:periplasmic divalent cation tolerance protein
MSHHHHNDADRHAGKRREKHDDDHDEKKACVIFSTSSPSDAERLASALVESGHVACVNIVPGVVSVYRWKGQIERSGECLLIIKCPRANVRAAVETLVKAHPYEVPEAIVLKVKGGHPEYLNWVLESAPGSPRGESNTSESLDPVPQRPAEG